MYLIDTSVWIDYFRGIENEASRHFSAILDNKMSFGISGLIYQEILQGAKSRKDFDKLTAYLSTQCFFHPTDEVMTYELAAQLYFSCRRAGITLRSSIDCLIAQIAIEHNLILLHNDKDYELIKQVSPQLTLYS